MSSIFAQTIAKAISEYRALLRRYLPQADRMIRLARLNLKDSKIYESEVLLYQTAESIIKDIHENVYLPQQGYYSYSGIVMFAEYLKEYLDKYEIENNKVIHRAQKASRALVQSIQLLTLPANRLSDEIAHQLHQTNAIIAEFGSPEQQELHLNNLQQYRSVAEKFFNSIIDHFKQCLQNFSETRASKPESKVA